MDLIKVSKVENVRLDRGNRQHTGSLHVLTHHLIFRQAKEELWIPYPLLHTVERLPINDEDLYPLRIRCHHFLFVSLNFTTEEQAVDVFEMMQKLTCITKINQFHAFYYQPTPQWDREEGWKRYDPVREYNRMGVNTLSNKWRFTEKNTNYELCPTYPRCLVVPEKISDVTLEHAAKFRSKGRIPVLSYLHRPTMTTISRSSQPMVGLRQSRSVQDEKLVEAIFTSERNDASAATGTQNRNLIIDARPTANAMANVAMGAGSENTENYRKCRKLYLGIDNIHVMRDSLNKIAEVYAYRYCKQYSNSILCDSMLACSCCCIAWMWSRPLCRSFTRHYRTLTGRKAISSTDTSGIVNKIQLSKSNWLRHIQLLLDGVSNIVRTVHHDRAHVLVHCSDGWDRTAQLTALASLCLDPYYRTLEGFAVLVEKEWCSFGHKFTDRCGHLTHERDFQVASGAQSSAAEATLSSIQTRLHQQSSHVRESSPVFHQFLDCCYQLWTQAPWRFEFNERFLIALHYHAYACQFGTFLCNTERERYELVREHTYSVWPHLDLRRHEFLNDIYDAARDQEMEEGIIIPDTNYLKYWASLFARRDEEVNGGLADEIALTETVKQRSTSAAAAATASMAKSAAAAMAGVVSVFSNGGSLPANPLIPTNEPLATEDTIVTATSTAIVASSVEEETTTSTGAVSPGQSHRVSLSSNGNNNEASTLNERLITEQMSTITLATHPLAEPSNQEELPYARDPFVANILFASSRSTKSPPTSSSSHTTEHHPYDTKSNKVAGATSHYYDPLEKNPWL
ncbi:Myotubularin-like phosphatase domain-containing protein [Syncephalis plumigaleata]|nr:Myotubularin-like phosphatase domain-containing protein [Syncephalis plumigaleata]